jgi:SAM-dependent methyltransferase
MDASGGYIDFPFVAEFYDHYPLYRDRGDTDFYKWAADKYGSPVLELGCGTGRVMLPVARAGHEIVGLDMSENMLDICAEKLNNEPHEVQSKIELKRGDMRAFDLGREFPLITTPFRCFQHLMTVEDQISCLKCVQHHLKQDGHLILELFNPSMKYLVDDQRMEEMGDDPPFTMPDGRTVLRRWRNSARDFFSQTLDAEIIYYVTHPNGREERLVHSFQIRYLFRYEAEHLLERTGFEVEHLYADFDNSPFGSIDPGELIFIARRR